MHYAKPPVKYCETSCSSKAMSSRAPSPLDVLPTKGIAAWLTSELVAEETRTSQLYSMEEHRLPYCSLPHMFGFMLKTIRKRSSGVAWPWWGLSWTLMRAEHLYCCYVVGLKYNSRLGPATVAALAKTGYSFVTAIFTVSQFGGHCS